MDGDTTALADPEGCGAFDAAAAAAAGADVIAAAATGCPLGTLEVCVGCEGGQPTAMLPGARGLPPTDAASSPAAGTVGWTDISQQEPPGPLAAPSGDFAIVPVTLLGNCLVRLLLRIPLELLCAPGPRTNPWDGCSCGSSV